LRRGLRFHNGKSIRSNDFRYSLERLKDTPHRWLQHLLKVTIIDDRRFVIDLAHPLSRSELGRLLATPALSILSANDSVAVGAGSFRVARRRSRTLRLNAVIDHIDGRPYVDAVEFRKVGNGDEAFKYRKVDLVLTPSSRFKASTHLRGSFSETVGLLFHRKFMDRDRGMRARFWSAIVRKEFTTRVAGEVRAAHGLHPDGLSFKPAGRHSTKQPIEGVLMCLESERRLALELAAGVATKGHRLTVLPVSAKSYALAQQGKGALHWDLMLVGYVHQDLSKDTAYNTLAQMVALEPGKDALLELKQQLLWIPIVDRAFSAVVVPALRGLVFTKDGSLHFESAYWAKP
jgi:MarR-like DNA-binding transcriptional regulator SgrR of sgrS sRNA